MLLKPMCLFQTRVLATSRLVGKGETEHFSERETEPETQEPDALALTLECSGNGKCRQ